MKNPNEEHGTDTNSRSKRQRTGEGSLGGRITSQVGVDKEILNGVVTFAKRNRGRALEDSKRLDILLSQAHLRYEHREKRIK